MSRARQNKLSTSTTEGATKKIKAFICIIISCSINNFYVPCVWKDSQVTMLPKPQKDRTKAENYRPFSLTNCIAKACETFVKNLILDHCEANKVFVSQQSAFRANRCTTDDFLALTQHIGEAYQWSEMVGLEQKTKHLLEANPNEITEDNFLNVEEFNKILKHTSKSCPGPDKISYQLLKALPKKIKAFICIIISCSINNFHVPCVWKASQVTMLPKPQKDRTKAENYRPFSLTNCIAKVCETFVKNLFLDHCEANKVFVSQQSAYRANRCTTDDLLVLT